MHDLQAEEKVELTRMIMSLLDNWDIPGEAILNILSLPAGTRVRALRRYRDNTAFPESEDLNTRIEHIVGIAEALYTTFPRNAHMRAQWMHQPQKRFNGRSAVNILMEDGLNGLINVRAHLDCTFAWKQTGALK